MALTFGSALGDTVGFVAKHVMFKPADAGEGLPQIVDGSRQEAEKWPATLGFKTDHNIFCTSTVVGEGALITAAHCVGEGRVWWADMGDGPPIKLSCDLDPEFTWRGLVSDIALCASDKPFPKSFMYENLDFNVATVQAQSDLFLLGYGCRQFPKPNEQAQTSAQLYGGLSKVAGLPKNAGGHIVGGHIVTKGGVVVCNGDSGGAAYALVDASVPTGPRSIIGMNSSYVKETRQSSIASLAAETKAFATTWADPHHVRICGVHPDAENCRDKFVP